jgi:iron complex transport system ATP-binding protein
MTTTPRRPSRASRSAERRRADLGRTVTARPDTTRLEASALTLGYADTDVVHDLDLRIPSGKVTVIVGANACGKSTLLRGLARLLRPRAGSVLLDGESIHRLPTKQVARTLGLLPQNPIAPEGVTVADLVARGRHPHHGAFARWTAEDERAVAEALTLTDTLGLADRVVDELSGGQRQRVWIAMALAQGTDLLLLDEPTTYLDVAHQVEMLDLLAELNARRGTTIVMVLHDLNLSARYADHLVALHTGRIVAEGSPREVVTEDVVRTVFGLDNRVIDDPVSHTPHVVPVGRHRPRHSAPSSTASTARPASPEIR